MLRMTAIPQIVAGIATRVLGILKRITVPSDWINKVAMTKVVEFYIPENFRRPMKWVPELDRGKVLEFLPQIKKSA